MIIGWIRLAFFMLIGLTIAYFLVAIYSRSVRREALENQWSSEGLEGDRDAYIALGMEAYEKGLKRRLLWLIYIIPMVVMSAVFLIVNWS